MRRRNNGLESRQNQRAARDFDRGNRTTDQQIALLDKRLGKGQGAVKERTRLLKPVHKAAAAEAATSDVPEDEPTPKKKRGKKSDSQ